MENELQVDVSAVPGKSKTQFAITTCSARHWIHIEFPFCVFSLNLMGLWRSMQKKMSKKNSQIACPANLFDSRYLYDFMLLVALFMRSARNLPFVHDTARGTINSHGDQKNCVFDQEELFSLLLFFAVAIRKQQICRNEKWIMSPSWDGIFLFAIFLAFILLRIFFCFSSLDKCYKLWVLVVCLSSESFIGKEWSEVTSERIRYWLL